MGVGGCDVSPLNPSGDFQLWRQASYANENADGASLLVRKRAQLNAPSRYSSPRCTSRVWYLLLCMSQIHNHMGRCRSVQNRRCSCTVPEAGQHWQANMQEVGGDRNFEKIILAVPQRDRDELVVPKVLLERASPPCAKSKPCHSQHVRAFSLDGGNDSSWKPTTTSCRGRFSNT